MLVRFGQKSLYSVLDLKDAFHQVPLHEDSRPYTCTSTPMGVYQWKVVVMGLKNGVAIFQRVVDFCLGDVRDIASAYVDDILVGTNPLEPPAEPKEICQAPKEETKTVTRDLLLRHDKDLRQTLDELRRQKLVASKKCKFFKPEVTFCGHILGGGKRRPAPGKLAALEMWEEPKTLTALRGFLGFTNYYASYVEGYGELVADLQDLLKVGKKEGKAGSKKPIFFTEAHRKAFRALKEKLLSGLSLHVVNPDAPLSCAPTPATKL